jgi:cell division protein FtsB
MKMKMTMMKGGHTMTIIWIVVIVLLLGLSGYLYFQNSSLSSQVSSLGGQSSNVTSQLSALNTQVVALTASNTALMAQANSLASQNADIANQLSFVAVPTGMSAAATSSVTVSGMLTGGKSSFALTTPYGIVVYVANAKTASVSAALTPLVGSTSTVQLTGIHSAGSQNITVTAVNGSSTIQ